MSKGNRKPAKAISRFTNAVSGATYTKKAAEAKAPTAKDDMKKR